MPQMAPLPWTIVFCWTFISLLFIATTVYFLFIKNLYLMKKSHLKTYNKMMW